MQPISIAFPWIRTRNETLIAAAEALSDQLPTKVSYIIGDYIYDGIDPTLIGDSLDIDLDGRVVNPKVRENMKRILASANCLPWCKVATIRSICSEESPVPHLMELATISNEIVAEGGRLVLDNVVLNHVSLCMNMRNASLRNLELSDSDVTGDLTGADLTGSRFSNVKFEYLVMIRAICTGMLITNSSFECVFITGADITAPEVLQFVCFLADPALNNSRFLPFILAIVAHESQEAQTHLFLHSKRDHADPVKSLKAHPTGRCLIC